MKYALKILREFFLDHKKKLLLSLLFMIMILLLIIPPLFNHYSKEKEKFALQAAQNAQASIKRSQIKALELNQSDLQKKEYIELKESLKLLLNINNEIDSSYLLRLEGESLLVIADSKDILSQEHKPSGTVLGSLSEKNLNMIKKDKPSVISDPLFGENFMAVIVPVKEEDTNDSIALYVNLHSKKTWNKLAIKETAHFATIVVVFYLLINAVYLVLALNYKLYKEKSQLIEANKQIKESKILMDENIRQLSKSEKKLSKILQMIPTMMVVTSNYGVIKEVNDAFITKLNYDRQSLVGKNIFEVDMFVSETQKSCLKYNFEKGQTLLYYETEIKSVDNKVFSVFLSMDIVTYQDQTDCIFSFIDITKRKKAEEQISNLVNKYKTIIAVSNSGGWEYNVESGNFYLTEEYFSMLGHYHKKSVDKYDLIKDWYEMMHPEDRDKAFKTFEDYVKSNKGSMFEHIFRLRHKDGRWLWILSRGRRLFLEDGKLTDTIIGTHIDITDLKKKEDEIEYLNYHDLLTGLNNRRSYEKELEKFLQKENLPLAIVMADVNGLKLTNDAFGHLQGDNLLIEVAKVIKSHVRLEDFVARLGGDEFIILMPKSVSTDAEKLVKEINASLAQNPSHNMVVSVSFGWATKKDDNEDYINVYKRAEYRMYRKKLSEKKSKRSHSIKLIFTALQEKSVQEKEHSHRVSRYCLLIGRELGLDYKEILELETAGLMHDIGKIGIEEEILNKKGRLSSDEWRIMKRHSEIGYRILSAANEFSDISTYVLHHHERWDGTGYPHKLKGEDIPLVSRIIAIADAYDAMTSQRCYKKILTKKEAVREIIENAGKQFDPYIAKLFVEKVLKQTWTE